MALSTGILLKNYINLSKHMQDPQAFINKTILFSDMLETILASTACVLASTSLLHTPGLVYDYREIRRNRLSTSNTNKAAVLIHWNWDLLIMSGTIGCGRRGQIAKFFTGKNTRINWFYNASSSDLEEVIRDPTYDSIAVYGHGSRGHWRASDGKVTTKTIQELSKGITKKGYWLQLTCGSKQGHTLGEYLMEDKSKVLGYNGGIGSDTPISSIRPLLVRGVK